METSKIPTAEELNEQFFGDEYRTDTNDLLIEFARLHVKAALEAAAEKAETERGYLNNLPVIYVTKKSILNAYPLDNIK